MKIEKDVYDCVIVGGGTAGLSAALLLGRARRRVLVCDQGKPRNAPAHESHSFFTRDGISPHELLRIGREQLTPYQTVEVQACGAKDIRKIDGQFEVVLDDGSVQKTRKILLAFGVKDEFPNIENFGQFWGNSVFHCPFCHGYEVRDQPLAVVGKGTTAIAMVALLRSWSHDLVLCSNGPAELSPEEKRRLEKYGVALHEEKIVRLEGHGGHLECLVFETGEKLARGGMLIRLKQTLRSDLAERLGCTLTEAGFVEVNWLNETSVPGVYAAGDITSPMQSISAASAQGAIAAGGGINHSLSQEDFI